MSYEHDQETQVCGCGSDCDCHNVTEDVVQEEQPMQVEEVETMHSCGCDGCGCN